MSRHDRAHGVWHTSRQKRFRKGPGRALNHVRGMQSNSGTYESQVREVDVQALLAYVRENEKRGRVNGR